MRPANTPPKTQPVAVYRYRPFNRYDLFTLVIPGALSVLVPLFYGLDRANYAARNFGPVAVGSWSRPWYVLALLALLVFLSLAFYRLVQARHFVAVYKKGLQIQLGRARIYRWEEIAGVAFMTSKRHFLRLTLQTRYYAVLYPGAGRPVELPGGIQNIPELVSNIKAHLYPRLAPEMQTNFQAGKWLYFGPVGIQQTAIKLGRGSRPPQRSIPWSGVDRLSVKSGYLVVELKDGPRRRLPVSQIPNLEILLDIIQSGVSA
jgi:hypothetical protein